MRYFVLLALAGLLVCPLRASAEERAWSKDGSFSLVPPSGWVVEKPRANKLILSQGKSVMEIESALQSVEIKDPAFKEKMCALVAARYTVTHQEEISMSGNPGLRCDLSGLGEIKDFEGRFVVVTDNHHTWFITYSTPREESSEIFPRLEQSLTTLQFR